MTTLDLPDPSLLVLIGPAGSGKSTFAARHFDRDEILSSDALRAVVGAGEADQRSTRRAFAVLHRRLVDRLGRGRFTVVDATSLAVAARRALIHDARAAGVPAIALVLDLPAAVVHDRNSGRTGRVVPAEVVDRHLAAVAGLRDVDALAAEGFERIHVVRSADDLDRLRPVRRPSS